MTRPRKRIFAPPPSGNREMDRWLQDVTQVLNNQIPAFIISSTTDGPESRVTAEAPTFLMDIGSSATTYWAKTSGTTTLGWQAISFV